MTDPIADMLSRIRNATIGRHARVDMPSSRLKVEIARILESEGYIAGFKVVEPQAGQAAQATLRVFLKYGPRGERVITGIQRVSRPGNMTTGIPASVLIHDASVPASFPATTGLRPTTFSNSSRAAV